MLRRAQHERVGKLSGNPFALSAAASAAVEGIRECQLLFSRIKQKEKPFENDISKGFMNLAPRAGLEPATIRLTAERSTN